MSLKNISRREFIQVSSIGSLSIDPVVNKLANQLSEGLFEPQSAFSCAIIRPADLLILKYYFYGFEIQKNKLVKSRYHSPFLILRVPQQHIAEQALDVCETVDEDGRNLPGDGLSKGAKSFLSGYSYLVFDVIKEEIELKRENLLNFDNYSIRTYPTNGGSNSNNKPFSLFDSINLERDINYLVSHIEYPYKTFLSPLPPLQDFHLEFSNPSNKLRELYNHNKGKYRILELWRNSLIQSNPTSENIVHFKVSNYQKKDNYDESKNEHNLIPSQSDREQLYAQTKIDETYSKVVRSEKFEFSSLGISAFVEYNNPDYAPLTTWKQKTNLGRDNLAVIEKIVYDNEFGFQWKFAKINERTFEDGVSYLQRRYYIEPIEKELIFEQFTKLRGREFKEIKIAFDQKIFVTPVETKTKKEEEKATKNVLKRFDPFNGSIVSTNFTLLREARSKDECLENEESPIKLLYSFPFNAVDHNDQIHELSVPLIFVPKPIFDNEASTNQFKSNLKKSLVHKLIYHAYYKINHNNIKIGFAPEYYEGIEPKDYIEILNSNEFSIQKKKETIEFLKANYNYLLDGVKIIKEDDTESKLDVTIKKITNNYQQSIKTVNNGLLTTHHTFSVVEINQKWKNERSPDIGFVNDRALVSRLFYAKVEIEALKTIDPNRTSNITYYPKYYEADDSNNPFEVFIQFLKDTITIPETYSADKIYVGNASALLGSFDNHKARHARISVNQDAEPEFYSRRKLGLSVPKIATISRDASLAGDIGPKGIPKTFEIPLGGGATIVGSIKLQDVLTFAGIDAQPLFEIVESVQSIIDSINKVNEIIQNSLDQLKGLKLSNISQRASQLKQHWKDLKDEVVSASDEFNDIVDSFELLASAFDSILVDDREKISNQLKAERRSMLRNSDYYKDKAELGTNGSSDLNDALLIQNDDFDLLYAEIWFRQLLIDAQTRLDNGSSSIAEKINILGSIWTDKLQFTILDQIFGATKKIWSNSSEYQEAYEIALQVYTSLKSDLSEDIKDLKYVDDDLIVWIRLNSILDFVYEEFQEVGREENFGYLKNFFDEQIKPDATEQPYSLIKDAFDSENFQDWASFENKYGGFKRLYQLTILEHFEEETYKKYLKDESEFKNNKSQKNVGERALSDLNDLVDQIKIWLKESEEKIRNNPTVKKLKADYKKLKDIYDTIQKFLNPEVVYNWETTTFKSAKFGFVSFHAHENKTTRLKIHARAAGKININTKSPFEDLPELRDFTVRTKSSLQNFGLTFFSSIKIEVAKLSVEGGTNIKEDVNLKISNVTFQGPLSFLAALQKHFESLGKILDFNISSAGIELSYLLPLPNLNAGVIIFTNLKFSIGLRIPFRPRTPLQLQFGINTKNSPFTVTAYGFPGKGHFIIVMEPGKGIVIIDITIEFGKTAKFNFGLAAGELSFRAGFYFRKYYDDVEFKAYVIAHGHIKILGFGFSIYFHLILRYKNGLLEGECLLILEKDLGFFEVKFKIHIKMTFMSPKVRDKESVEYDQKKYIVMADPNLLNKVDSDSLGIDTIVPPKKVVNPSNNQNLQSKSDPNNIPTKDASTVYKKDLVKSRSDNYSYESYYKSYYNN